MRTRVTVLAAVAVFPLAVATVAVVAGRGGGGAQDLVKLPVGSLGAMVADDAASTADRSELLAPEGGAVEYRLAGPMPDLPSTAPAYRLASATTAAEVGRVGAALGLDAAAAEHGGAWVVRDGERELRVEPVAGLPWHLGPACAEAPVSSDDASVSLGKRCAVAVEASVEAPGGAGAADRDEPARKPVGMPAAPRETPGEAPPEAPPEAQPEAPPEKPSRPADLPSREEAERLAREVFTRLGVGFHALSVEDGWLSWEARVQTRVDGLEVLGLGPSLSIGPRGRIERANGFLAKPDRIGDYPLVGFDNGLERLRGNLTIGPRPLAVEEPSLAVGEPSLAVDDLRPHPVVRTIVGVHLALFQVDAVLVPVYVFELDGGEEAFPVPAVTDEWLEQQTPRRERKEVLRNLSSG